MGAGTIGIAALSLLEYLSSFGRAAGPVLTTGATVAAVVRKDGPCVHLTSQPTAVLLAISKTYERPGR
jgi:hypothetical protein